MKCCHGYNHNKNIRFFSFFKQSKSNIKSTFDSKCYILDHPNYIQYKIYFLYIIDFQFSSSYRLEALLQIP